MTLLSKLTTLSMPGDIGLLPTDRILLVALFFSLSFLGEYHARLLFGGDMGLRSNVFDSGFTISLG